MGFPGGSVVKIHLPMQEPRVRSLGLEDSLDKEMATHPSILAWEIPWTEKPGGATVHRVTKESDVTERLKQQYIKQINNKDLWYSTGNSTQYSVMAYMGKESKKEWIYG